MSVSDDVLAERDADIESNLVLLARKQSPAYHDDAPQYCRVCGIFSIVYSGMDDFCLFSLPPFRRASNLGLCKVWYTKATAEKC